MTITIREADVKATPATIWQTCFVPMKWESWDVDVERMEDVSGGVENGTTFNFVMKSGGTFPVTLSDVQEHQTIRFAGATMGGLVKFDGYIEITDKTTDTTGDSSDGPLSHVKYSFDLTGFIGRTVMFLNPKPAVNGTEVGLKNIVQMSEKAQADGQ